MKMADPHAPAGLEAAFLANRAALLRFVRARGAGEGAEDLLQDLWLKIAEAPAGPVGAPLSYLYRAADRLLIDRYRSARQSALREQAWSALQADAAEMPGAERQLAAVQLAALVAALLDGLEPPRVGAVFRRHRVDGLSQRQIAAEFGVSLSTVENDLRRAYRALAEFRSQFQGADQ